MAKKTKAEIDAKVKQIKARKPAPDEPDYRATVPYIPEKEPGMSELDLLKLIIENLPNLDKDASKRVVTYAARLHVDRHGNEQP